eukprot:4810456-Prymnesium_polylepis.1
MPDDVRLSDRGFCISDLVRWTRAILPYPDGGWLIVVDFDAVWAQATDAVSCPVAWPSDEKSLLFRYCFGHDPRAQWSVRRY